jgi:pimeloyl-ACP methyl ester carboxylesterase
VNPGWLSSGIIRKSDFVRIIVPSPFGPVHTRVVGHPASPPVLVGPGLGSAWFDWCGVLDLLAPFAHATVYARPGAGGSGRLPLRRPLSREVEILDSVRGSAAGPVVLVGHSIAAIHVEAAARLRPERVKGVVLVDPDPEVIGAGRPFDLSCLLGELTLIGCRIPAFRAGFGWSVRHFGVLLRRVAVGASTLGWADPVPLDVLRERYSDPVSAEAALAELAGYADQVAELDRLRLTHPLPAVPWVVLTAGRSSSADTRGKHRELASLVPGGRQVTVPGSRHMMPLDRPDAIARTIRDMLGYPGV